MTLKKTPQHFYTGEELTFECPRGHTVEAYANQAETTYPHLAFRGYCPKCESDWKDFTGEHQRADDWEEFLDDNYPDDPTYFEIIAQRVFDWQRRIAHRVDDPKNKLPERSSFEGMVTWTARPETLGDPDG